MLSNMLRFVLSTAQRAVINMISQRSGAIRMNVSESAIGHAGVMGLNQLRDLGLIDITPLVGTSEADVRLTEVGRKVAQEIQHQIKGA